MRKLHFCQGCIITLFVVLVFASSRVNSKIQSQVLELNDKFLDVKHQGFWLVEFYAPWCGHCKKLHPVWEQVAHALADDSQVRVAKLDCTRFGNVASALGIAGFPTIKYFREGEEFTYEGDRSKDAILEFAYKAGGPVVRSIAEGEKSFLDVFNRHFNNAFFLLVVNEELDNQVALAKAYEACARQMITKAFFYSVSVSRLPKNVSVVDTPAVLSVKGDQYYSFIRGSGALEADLQSWINKERWSLFPEITYGILYDLGTCCNKLLVIAVLRTPQKSKKGTLTHKFARKVGKVALEYRNELPEFQFGWTDGNELANNVIMGTMDIPSLLVLNVSTSQYYLPIDKTSEMTEKALVLFLKSIATGSVQPLGGRSFTQRLKRMAFDIYSTIYMMFSAQPLLSCCLFGLPLGILSIICYTICSSDASIDPNEIYEDSEFEDDDHEKLD